MSYTVLARKYRPQRFSDVIGQDHVTRTLKNAIEQQRIAHGYIFSGHRGIGKTTIARILAMALNCRSTDHPVTEPCGVCDSCREIREGSAGAMDVIEIDAASNRGIDEVRGLIATATAEPARDRYRIFILDEAHQVTDAAFNALLKTLEEPPPWVIFMMATTQPEDIPQTIRSRCQHFSFHAVRFEDIIEQLRTIARQEQLEVEDDALALLAEAGDGSMRDALSIMDQAIACCGTTLTTAVVRGLIGTVNSSLLETVMTAVHDNNSEEVLRIIDRLLVEGHSPVHFARQVVRFLRNAIVAKVAGGDSALLQVSSDERTRVVRVAAMFTEEDLTRFLQIMLRTHGDVSYKQEQRFHLELGVLKLVHAQRLLPLEQLLSDANLAGTKPALAGSAGTVPSVSRGLAATPVPSRTIPGASGKSGLPANESPGTPFGGTSGASHSSPFERDRARKGGSGKPERSKPEMTSGTASALNSQMQTKVPQAKASQANDQPASDPQPKQLTHMDEYRAADVRQPHPSTAGAHSLESVAVAGGAAVAVGLQEKTSLAESHEEEVSLETLQSAVLAALEAAGHRVLANALEDGEWRATAAELTIKAPLGEQMLQMAFGPEQKSVMQAAARSASGRSLRVLVLPGAAKTAARNASPKTANLSGAHAKAAGHPVVRRMMEKFGAELRTVLDSENRRNNGS